MRCFVTDINEANPLTLAVGIYGMNIKHMPELEWRCSYRIV
ncbi:MAG: hypothetical protein H8D56_03575 [Planctomycetes bacterium]|nr:hypothetical protein [Planctomycetota bacterium]MBL7146476.1 hypothetical protein [Phycisphaerae bacterium]